MFLRMGKRGVTEVLFTANVPGGVFLKGMLRDAKQNPEAASAIWSGMLQYPYAPSLCNEMRAAGHAVNSNVTG